MTKRRAIGAFLVLSAMALAGCSKSTPAWEKHKGSPHVVVTIPALDNFVRNVGGDRIGVICLCTTQGPHHYEYNPQDAIVLRDADLFFAVGLELDEKFADQAQIESHNARLRYVKLGERLPAKLLLATEHEEGKGEAKHDHGHDHEHGEHDPHVWLGIPQAVAMVEMIRDELSKVDAAHADEYKENATTYIEKLNKLQADGQAKLKNKKNRKIIAFHESLAYFAKSFDLTIVDAIEVTPGQPAPPEHLMELVKKCAKNEVRVIAVEPQYPAGSTAEVLQKEDKRLQLVVVDPLETVENSKEDLTDDRKELKRKDWYEKKMSRNIDNLAKSLP